MRDQVTFVARVLERLLGRSSEAHAQPGAGEEMAMPRGGAGFSLNTGFNRC
jgi:hypothetical protein